MVNECTILRCIVLTVKLSLTVTVVRPSQASMMLYVRIEQCSCFFLQWRTGHVQKQVAGEVSVAPGADNVVVARVYTGVAYTRYLSVYLLRRTTRNLRFDPPKLGNRPNTGELIASWYHSLLLQSPSPRSCGLQVAGCRPVVL